MIARRKSRGLFLLVGVAVGGVSLALIVVGWQWRAHAVAAGAHGPQAPGSLANNHQSPQPPRKPPEPARQVAGPAPRFAASYALACAALRDRGLDPRQGPATTKADAKGD